MHMWLDSLTIALIASTTVIIAVRYVSTAIKWLAFQSFALGLFTFALAAQTHGADLYVIAALTLIVKAGVIPVALHRTLRKVGIERQAEAVAPRGPLVIGVLVMWVLGYFVTPKLSAPDVHTVFLSVAIGMLLCGVLIMITHYKAMMQGIGLIVMENSLFLAALATTFGLPLIVDIGIFADVIVVVVLIMVFTLRMDEHFASMHTRTLRRLRG